MRVNRILQRLDRKHELCKSKKTGRRPESDMPKLQQFDHSDKSEVQLLRRQIAGGLDRFRRERFLLQDVNSSTGVNYDFDL